jgi:hypothetical protein
VNLPLNGHRLCSFSSLNLFNRNSVLSRKSTLCSRARSSWWKWYCLPLLFSLSISLIHCVCDKSRSERKCFFFLLLFSQFLKSMNWIGFWDRILDIIDVKRANTNRKENFLIQFFSNNLFFVLMLVSVYAFQHVKFIPRLSYHHIRQLVYEHQIKIKLNWFWGSELNLAAIRKIWGRNRKTKCFWEEALLKVLKR